jgi:predicted DNA-binding protein (MmcQ/YjbR family)
MVSPSPKASSKVDQRLNRIEAICHELAEAVTERKGCHAAFQVRKKTFAYYLHNHHGDGIVSIACKVGPGDNQLLAQAQPDRFYLPAYIGSRGWVALRLDRGKVDWEEVRELLRDSYRCTAPKRLAATVSLAAL